MKTKMMIAVALLMSGAVFAQTNTSVSTGHSLKTKAKVTAGKEGKQAAIGANTAVQANTSAKVKTDAVQRTGAHVKHAKKAAVNTGVETKKLLRAEAKAQRKELKKAAHVEHKANAAARANVKTKPAVVRAGGNVSGRSGLHLFR